MQTKMLNATPPRHTAPHETVAAVTPPDVTASRQAVSHEEYLESVRQIAVLRLNDDLSARPLRAAKLVYGSGPASVRGQCIFAAWDAGVRRDFLEICAQGEESPVQLAGTTIHELAHCLAGPDAGHGKNWRAAAHRLGLENAKAAGQEYRPTDFASDLWAQVAAIAQPTDGSPAFHGEIGSTGVHTKPCPLGIGTRRGKSRGPGSGSRLRLFVCDCVRPLRLRVASRDDYLSVQCLDCKGRFHRIRPESHDEISPATGSAETKWSKSR